MEPEDVRGRGMNLETGMMGDVEQWDERFRTDPAFRAAAIANHERVLAFEATVPPARPPGNRSERRRRR